MIAFLAILIMGFVLGLLGGGGSILTVPILVYLFKINAMTATAYSLFIVGTAASVGAFKNYKLKNLNIKVGLLFSLPGLVGVFTSRAYILPSLPEIILKSQYLPLNKDNFILAFFAIMMILASYSMIFGRTAKSKSQSLNSVTLGLLGFSVGLVTGFVGAGGGFIIIPVLNSFAGLDIKKSMGTSLFIISINSLLGFSGDLLNMTPNWALLAKLSSLAVAGILVGTYCNSKVPAKLLKKGFGIFVLTLGSWIIYKQVAG